MLLATLLPLFLVTTVSGGVLFYQPEQIHLAYGESIRDFVVTWSTGDDTKGSVVEYGIDGLTNRATGYSRKFVDGGAGKHSQFIHRVTLNNLTESTKYYYHCGSDLGWSNEFWFVTPPKEENWSPHIALYGDMGNENAQSLPRLQEETQKGMYDAILHVGDFAYDMNSVNSEVGNEFMRQIESIAAYLPYMTCAGNHEEAYNFSNYRARFSMPGGTENLFFSFNMGPIHFISFSTEVYYFLNYGIKPVSQQYSWLVEDLKKANLPENRKKQPWIIAMGHRPMYCSNLNNDDCTHHESLVRTGLPFLHVYGLEKLFMDYGVDVEIWAHEHDYERLWPIYDFKIYNGSLEEPYTNPKSPVHFVTGSAGCKEGNDHFSFRKPYWSAYRSRDYGFTRLKAYNSTHIHFEQVSDNQKGKIIDAFWVIKDKHGPYNL